MHSCPAWSTGELKDGRCPGKVMFQAILQLLCHFPVSCILLVGKVLLQNCIVNGVQDPATKTMWCPVVNLGPGHSFLLSNSRLQQKMELSYLGLYPNWLWPWLVCDVWVPAFLVDLGLPPLLLLCFTLHGKVKHIWGVGWGSKMRKEGKFLPALNWLQS